MKKALAGVFVFAALIFLLAYLQSVGVAAERDCRAPESPPDIDVPHGHHHEDGRNDKKGHEIEDAGKSITDEVVRRAVEDAVRDAVRGR
jgi:hypothetical protein